MDYVSLVEILQSTQDVEDHNQNMALFKIHLWGKFEGHLQVLRHVAHYDEDWLQTLIFMRKNDIFDLGREDAGGELPQNTYFP